MGRNLFLGAPPRRIVSLVPSQTELLAALGLEEEVVGITRFCVHPESWFRNKKRVGGTKDVNLERVRELEPDLIIGNKEENERDTIEALAEEYPVWMSDIHTLEDALEMIRSIGQLTDRMAEADQLAGDIEKEFSLLEKEVPPRSGIRTLYLIWRQPWMGAACDTFIHEMLHRAGFANVLEKESRYPELSEEILEELNPDLVLLSSEPYPFQEKHLEEIRLLWPQARVELVDGEPFSWYGSKLLSAPAYFRQLRKKIAEE